MIHSIVSGDWWFENLMLSIRSHGWLQFFKGVTFFGSTMTIIMFSGIVILFLAYHYKIYRSYLIGFVVTLSGAAATGYAMKEIVGRARPGGLIQAVVETSPSFPSGHATGSVAFYGFIAVMLCRLYPKCRVCVTVITTVLILTIGFSRLYLGAHFPSDVIAGYVVGGLWLWAGVWLVDRLESKKTIA